MRMLALAAATAFTSLSVFAQSGSGTAIPHQFVIRAQSHAELGQLLADYNLTVVDSFPARLLYVVSTNPLMPDRTDEELKLAMEHDNRLVLREENRENSAVAGHTQSFFVSATPGEFSLQPAFDQIEMELCPLQWTGQGVTVAILDTGVSPHVEYGTNIRNDGTSFIDSDESTDDVARGLDTNVNNIPDELAGHGTFMAGLITHVAPGCQILPIRVLDSDGVGTSFAVAAGIYYAIDHGADVINLSLSSAIDTVVVSEAVQEALASGITVVAAVANSASSVRQYPAANVGVIAVTACDLSDHLLPTSDFGSYVMFSAPGQGVVSTFPGNSFASASGTSISTALVSGSIARIRSCALVSSVVPALYNGSALIDDLNPNYSGMIGRGLRIGPASFGLNVKPIDP